MVDQDREKKEILSRIEVKTFPHVLEHNYGIRNHFAIITADGEEDLENKAREAFMEVNFLPEYIYLDQKKELKVNDTIVYSALVFGVYLS